MELTLVHLSHSPWSQKARCALRHHRLAVQLVEYKPLLGEPALRMKLALRGRFAGKVTVPVLFTREGPLCDSWDITRFADRVGNGSPLVPDEHAAAIDEWNARCERIMTAGRARFMVRVQQSEAAMREVVPAFASRWPLAFVRTAIQRFSAKYAIRAKDYDQHGREIEAELDRLQTTLSDGRPYLLGPLTAADLALGIALQALRPVPGTWFGPVCEQTAHEEDWCRRYSRLLDWRDQLQARHDLFA